MTREKSSTSPTITRKDWFVAFFLVMLTMLMGSWYMVAGVSGVFHDDGIYVSTAKALAEGQGYRQINLPEAPAQTKFPPLYPAILAIIWKLYPTFPDNLVFMQFITLFCGALVVGLAYLYMVRFGYFSRGVAAGAGALTLTSSFYIYFCTVTLSELPFALTAMVALWALDRQDESPFLKPGKQFLLGVLLTLPMLMRTIGGLFIPFGIFRLWRRGTSLVWAILGIAALLLPWLGWMLLIPRWFSTDSVAMYYTNYLMWWYSFGTTAFGQVISKNILFSAMGTMIVGISLFHPDFFSSICTTIIALVLGIVTWSFIVKDSLRARTLPTLLIVYLIIILLWPWPPIRFLVPLLPFLIAYLLSWIKQVQQRVPLIHYQYLVLFFLGAFLVVNLSVLARVVRLNHYSHYPHFRPIQEGITWQSYVGLFRWIQNHTKPGDVIASGLDTMIFLYTGRQAFRPFTGRPVSLFYGGQEPPLGSWEEIFHSLERHQARFLVQLPMPSFSEEKHFATIIEQLLSRCPGLLKPVYVAVDSRFRIYEILQPISGNKTFCAKSSFKVAHGIRNR